ncbi:MAG: helix-turn-helix transcriptional regulator, partial [candidate division NC10 bacterium]|nr:helix-turn-helix transcriptional regulator [candidate division NC10 bacterium]
TELSEPFDVSLPAISKHVRVLEEAGLLVRERDGRVHRCHLGAAPLRRAADWIARYERFWGAQLDALDRYLNTPKGGKPWRKPSKRSRTTRSTTRRATG